MPEPSQPRQKPRDITRLLYKAVRELPEEEQAAVFEYFLELGVGVQRPSMAGPMSPSMHIGLPGGGQQPLPVFPAHKGAGGANQQIIPVRLSEDTHRRLKQWSADHDFHMSVVVRGLIERFLDGWQEPGASGPAAAGA